eukprot:556320-Rhodomonas_salina.1
MVSQRLARARDPSPGLTASAEEECPSPEADSALVAEPGLGKRKRQNRSERKKRRKQAREQEQGLVEGFGARDLVLVSSVESAGSRALVLGTRDQGRGSWRLGSRVEGLGSRDKGQGSRVLALESKIQP